MQPKRPDPIERRVCRSRFDDGLLDIVLGVSSVGLALDLALREGWLWPAIALVSFLVYRGARRRWILPRMGRVVFRESTLERQGRTRRRIIGLQVFFVVLGITYALLKTNGQMDAEPIRERVIFGLVVGCIVSTGAIVFDLPRLYLLAALLAGGLIAGAVAGSPDLTASLVAVAGAISILTGALLLSRFLGGTSGLMEEGSL